MNHLSKFVLSRLTTKLFTKGSLGLRETLSINKKGLKSMFIQSKYQFSTFPQSESVFSKQAEPEMFKLQQEYKESQNLGIFESLINKSTGLNDQMTIFKIFKVMESSPFNQSAYENLFKKVNTTFKKKSDNMLLLLAQIKKKVAQNHKLNQKYQIAIECLQQALDILEYSMVPPLFPYYSIYRQYGLIHDTIGEHQKAKEILTETVEILNDFVSNSDDAVSTDEYCKKQATSYNCLARVDKINQNKWISKAEQSWKGFMGDKYSQEEYAKTIALNFKKLLKEDKEKAEAYFHFNLYNFKNKEFKDLLQKTKQQSNA